MRRSVFVSLAVAVAAAALPSAAPAAVSVGHSAWEWGNPRPQGNTFLSIEFQNTGFRAYAGGSFGTLVRTDDAGATWSGVPTGITAAITRIEPIGSDSVVLAADCSLRRSDDGGVTFRRLPWTPRDIGCASSIAGIDFPSADVGYVLTQDGTVLRSLDGGRSWSRRTALPGTPATGSGGAGGRDVHFTSADVGLAVIGAGAGGAILRTTDGGASWTTVQSSPTGLNDLTDSATNTPVAAIYAVGEGGRVYRSEDGGVTWVDRSVTVGRPPLDLTSMRCSDSETCIAAKRSGDELLRTTDGGLTWTAVSPSTEQVFAVALNASGRAIAVGRGGVTVVSGDAGQTWSRIGDALAGTFHAVRANSSALAFSLGGNGSLARSTDSGETWASISVPTAAPIADVSFPSANVGYALDGAGTLFRTENGGTSWAILDTGTTAVPRAVVALDEATVLLVGPRGLRRSTDAGQTFDVVTDRVVRGQSLDSVDRAGSALFVWGPTGRTVAVSQNGGRSWRRIPRAPTRRGVGEYDWISPRIGYALDRDGRVWQTRNGGRRWVELATTGTQSGFDIAFSSLTEGYLVIGDYPTTGGGYVLRTIDAGRTWRPQLVSSDLVVDVAAPGGGTDFALAGTSFLLRSSQVSPQDRDTTLTLTPRRRRPSGSRPRARRRATVQLNGRLSPPEGAERVVVSSRPLRGARWTRQVLTVASNGSFTVTKTITGPTIFVAQWEGDDDRRGTASRAVVLAPR